MKIVKLPFAAAVLAACAFSMAFEAQAAGVQRGAASWYGPGFHGRRTASGESFNSNAMTAAHRTLPFGTRVRVVNERTGRSVVVRINDRGPFHSGRIIDLAAAPARALGMGGTTYVSLHTGV
jgi:rare lipoprotein A